MNKLLNKQLLNENITKEQFIEDVNCLFENIKDVYGMYYYFGEKKFETVYRNTMLSLEECQEFIFHDELRLLKNELSFIKDGHFKIGENKETFIKYNYAVRYSIYNGIYIIDCKKFYFENEIEKEQLKLFSIKGAEYRNDQPLILDFRGNTGGSTKYIYDFLCDLLNVDELVYEYKYIQRSSKLFIDWLNKEGIDWNPSENETTVVENITVIPNRKKIYVLVDEYTASAAEEAIAFLKNIENVTIIGKKTAGCYSCGNCFDFYLPNSHLKVYFGTGILLYKGNINIDAEGGFEADISNEEFEKTLEKLG